MGPRRFLFLALVALLALAAHPARSAAQTADVIRGQIVDPDGAPVVGARVTVTSISGNVSREARSGKDGRFAVTFPNGDGDYMVAIAALGFTAKRFEVKRSADEDILIADARLSRAAAQLDAMKITAPREKVSRNDVQPDVGGTEQPVTNDALPAADLGDLAAMAATLPGVSLVPGQDGDPNGFSVLGLGADQNNMTLNGMSFGGSSLPRDAAITSSLVTAPYDVSRGGFSGAQFVIRSRPGSNFSLRGMSLNVDAPQLQWTDPAARALGQEYTNVSLGGLAAGALAPNKAFYNVAYQAGRRASGFQSLLNTSPTGLQAAGVAADSVNRFLGILAPSGVPTSIGGLPSNRYSDQASVFGSVDVAPPSSTSGQAINVSFNGGWNHLDPLFSSATGLPTVGGQRSSWNGGVQTRHTAYIGNILTETTLGVSGSTASSEPYLLGPAGRVRVNSTFADGTNGVQLLSFGGSASPDTRQSASTVGFLNQLSWFSTNNKHRLKLTTELRRDGYAQDQAANELGTFVFNSLGDLQAGTPSLFTRQLASRRSGAAQLVAGTSLGDSYRVTRDLQLQYGVRLDANRFLDRPAIDPDVGAALGIANDHVPDKVYASPRLGFSWTYGTAPQVSGFAGAARVPRAVVRGGVGIFQNTPSTNLVGSAIDNTGLASALQQITCVGSAVPTPDWPGYATSLANVPDRCADGSTGSVFANAAPNVVLFAPDYAAPRSLRSNLQWSGPVADNRLMTTVDLTYSRNMNQASTVDVNFDPTQRFTLDGEGGRPVYVQPTSIVPATGTIASADARRTSLFSRVSALRSDLLSDSRRLTVSLSPGQFSTRFNWGLSYVYSSVREQTRGFGGNTAGNPLDVAWGRSAFDSHHQIVYNLGYNFFDVVRLGWYGQFRSGTPFTPLVAGDINGDGWSNDRAFVFKPSATSDPAVASAMQTLLTSGSAEARACLQKQLGTIAGRNSCQGPWTSTATLSLSFNPVKVRMPQRASISFQLSNPLGAADQILHGENNLRGWGQAAIPDQSLLYVRGFDPATRSYKYEVNQRFGATDPARSVFRTPVTLTAMMRVDVGPTRERQMLTSMLDRGRTAPGDRLPEPFIKGMLGGGGFPNPLASILRQQDSLQLTAPQADSVATLNRWYSVRLDSIWSPVAAYLGALPNRYDQSDAYDRYLAARRASVDLLARIVPDVTALLTPVQRRKLPSFISGYLDPRYLASIRSGTMAFTGGGFIPPGAGGGPVGGPVGGGGQVVIIRN